MILQWIFIIQFFYDIKIIIIGNIPIEIAINIIPKGILPVNKNPVPIMIGHALIEIASVVMILMTSISPELYQTMLNM